MEQGASTTSLEAQDEAARERALDPRRSIILQAPAGSGKTTILTQRLLRVLGEVDEPEEVLAITFTRKAAAEMRARVHAALAGGAERTSVGAKLQELAGLVRARSSARGWDLESNPGRLRIQTIDAFARGLALQLPAASRANASLELTEHPASLYELAARRALIDAEADERLRPDLERLLERLDHDPHRGEQLFATMLAVRAHWLPLLLRASADGLPARVAASLASIGEERAAAAAQLLGRALMREGFRLLAVSATPARVADGAATIREMRALAELALTDRGTWRRALTRREGFPPADGLRKNAALEWIATLGAIPGARDLLTELQTLPDTALDTAGANALASLARLLRFAAAELDLVFAEAGRIDFPYVTAAARRALTEEGAPTDLSLRLGYRLRHILVDEFQDTSSEQVDLLRAVTAGWEPGDGRSLFLVGDPMQSIYLFRQAEVGLFLRCAMQGLGGLPLESLTLRKNFRADADLVRWLNESFSRVFPSHSDLRTSAVPYAPCVSSRVDEHAGRVCLHALPAGDPDAEVRLTLEIIRRTRVEHPGRSLAVLVAARTHAAPLVAALRAARIPVAGVDLVALGEVPVVRDLAVLTRALDHLADRTAWLALLRAPWCGLTLRELTSLLGAKDPRTVYEVLEDRERVEQLPPDAQQRLQRVHVALRNALARRGTVPFATLVESTWLQLGGPATCSSPDDLSHAERFLERLAAWSSAADWRGTDDLPMRIEELFASDVSASADAVQIMTIHRAKGLEFGTVIVPGLARTVQSDSEPLLRWLELPGRADSMDLLVAPIAPSGAPRDGLNAYLKWLGNRRLAHERARLLYVAATRARSELHLLWESPPAAADEEMKPPTGSLLATLWPAIQEQVPRGESAPAAAPASEPGAPRVPMLRRFPERWVPPPIAYPRVDTPEVADDPIAPPDFAWATYAARLAGRVVHERLREYARSGRLPSNGELATERTLVTRRLAHLGLEGSALARAATRALDALGALAADPHARWLFAAGHQEACCPLELTGLIDGRLVNASADRSFVTSTGERWVVNVKIGVHRDENVEAFIASEVERYRSELARVVELARLLGPEPIRAGLYFPLLGAFRELETAYSRQPTADSPEKSAGP